MVYFFTAEYTPPADPNDFLAANPPTTQTFEVYMGKDKYENDLLIQYGLDIDVWFHVDNLSSAHVYLRMKDGWVLDDIPDEIVKDCAALCKANSIAGCKQASTQIIYTRWKNLKKTSGMKEGEVGYHRPQNVRRIKIEKCPDRIKRLNKTKVERNDLKQDELARLQQDYLNQQARKKKKHYQQLAQQKKAAQAQRQEEKHAKSYDRLFVDHGDQMTSNRQQQAKSSADATAAEEYEDDFF